MYIIHDKLLTLSYNSERLRVFIMRKTELIPITAEDAVRLPMFKALTGNAIKVISKDDGNSYKWQLKGANIDVQVALLNYHFPITVRDNNVFFYDDVQHADVEVTGAETINAYLGQIKSAYNFTGGAKVSKDDLRNIYTLSSKHAQFAVWDGQPRAFKILDEFFTLDTGSVAFESNEEAVKSQMRLAFMVWALQHVARLKGMGTLKTGDIQYSLFPILLSMDKEIGKSSFLNHLLNTVGSTGETNLEMLLNPIQRGRLFSQHQALILNELSPFEVAKNIEKIKELATLNAYTVDEKFEKAVDLLRETAIVATSNRPIGDFSQHQTERRIQLITILRKQEPTDFEDYPFEQFWAELSWLTDTMPKKDLKNALRWGTEHTIQPDGDDDSGIFDFIKKIVNDAMTVNLTQPENKNIIKVNNGRMILREQFSEKAKRNKGVLDSLGLKPQVDGMTGNYIFSEMTFMRRMRSYLAQFLTKTGQLKEIRTNSQRGFLVTDVVNQVVKAKEDLNLTSLSAKQKALHDVYNTTDQRTGLHRYIADLPVWNKNEPLDETLATAVVDISRFNGHMIVYEMTGLNLPIDVPTEVDEETGVTRAYFWLSDDNVDRLIYNETFDIKSNAVALYNTEPHRITTNFEWLDKLHENTGLGWLLKYRTVAELDNAIKHG